MLVDILMQLAQLSVDQRIISHRLTVRFEQSATPNSFHAVSFNELGLLKKQSPTGLV
jgi:hypothetical protein